MPDLETVQEHSGKLLRLVMNRPKGNILDSGLMAQLEAAVRQASASRVLRLITLEGQGDHFSFGAAVEEHTRYQVTPMLQGLNRLIKSIAASPVPVAALVQGKCLGGAFELAPGGALCVCGLGCTVWAARDPAGRVSAGGGCAVAAQTGPGHGRSLDPVRRRSRGRRSPPGRSGAQGVCRRQPAPRSG
ncbi:MAG: hypothetical protein IPP14_06090 [Planctomycetes bacterium]|nr:hypothetical protein [Planctomycetota bacterium]